MKNMMNKNIKRLLITLLVIICHTTFGAAQTITGTVTELFGGAKEPIMGANVVLVNSQNRYVKGTVTDMNGNYNLQVPKDAKNLKDKIQQMWDATFDYQQIAEESMQRYNAEEYYKNIMGICQG